MEGVGTTEGRAGSRLKVSLFLMALAGCSDGSTEPTNTTPTASAGADQTVGIFETVSLAGTASDADGDALTYSWSFVNQPVGSTATFSSTTTAATTFVADSEGAFEVQLSVSDGTATATDDVTITVTPAPCDALVDLFPVPVLSSTSLFPGIDDDFLEVSFRSGFQFSFYGTSYGSVFLNTNGGMTFGGGEDEFDVTPTAVRFPGIAVFWGDMDAAEYGADLRANQMSYLSCDDRFVVMYDQFQDNDDEAWNNTGTATLFANGRIEIEYGTVLSEDILAGVFDGTHTDDRYLSIGSEYADYFSTGTGIILMDHVGPGPTHMGELTDQMIVFNPIAPAAFGVSFAQPAERAERRTHARGPKGPKR